jgi:retron-type reverse transcriptase
MNNQDLGTRYDRVLRWVAAPANISRALAAVLRRGGAPGLDGMSAAGLAAYLKTQGGEIRGSIGDGSWQPGPLRKGRHLLLVPNYIDRLVFQALLQVLEPLFEKTFSNGNCRDPAQQEAREREFRRGGYVLCPFLDRFVDAVDHQILLRFIKKRIKDPKLIVMLGRILGNSLLEEGQLVPLDRGIRQGGCLSALFCDIYLNEFDRKLESRAYRFTRCKDSYRIYLTGPGEAREVFDGSAEYFAGKLKIQVNEEKSRIEGPDGALPVRPEPPAALYPKALPA